MAAVVRIQPRNLQEQLWPNVAVSSLHRFQDRRRGVHFRLRKGRDRGSFGVVFASSVRNSSSNASRVEVVEHVCLLKAKEGLSEEEEKDMLDYLYTSQYHMRGILAISLGGLAEDALASFENLITQFPTLIVQSTQGHNFNSSKNEYTHGVVIRFRSVDACEIFITSREYKSLWISMFQPICRKSLCVQFSVDPIGNQIM